VSDPDWELVEEFFYHINERHRIYQKRFVEGLPPPWTKDLILRKWFFTNVKRELDRTTRHLREKYYNPQASRPAEEILMNCGIFRYFCHIDYIDDIGWQYEWKPDHLIEVARRRSKEGLKNFTNAFVITNNGIKKPKEEVVVEYFLADYVEKIPKLLKAIKRRNRWQDAIEELNNVYGFSNFMSKEVILDVMMTPLLDKAVDKYIWSPAGPGAKIGIHMIWHLGEAKYNGVRNSRGDFMPYMKFLYDIRDNYLEDHTKNLDWTVHDIQWNLCEFQKRINIKKKGKGKRRHSPGKN
jgi:hypothetical protein